MGFLNGRATIARYRIVGSRSSAFDEMTLEKLSEHAAGRQRMISGDGIEVGWSAGGHVLDTSFDLAKNVIDDKLYFCLRIDSMKLPSDLLKAYYEIDLKALSANNPSGHASARQKREAKESARDRLEEEAKDGRFKKRKAIECLWDRATNELLFGTASVSQIERLHVLLKNTFGVGIERIGSGELAYASGNAERMAATDNVGPAPFVASMNHDDMHREMAWAPDEASRDFLGNEFLLWLWFQCEDESAEFKLADGSVATVFLSKSVTLECPRGQTGQDTMRNDGPTRLPEAKRAIQSGKLPRKCGMTLVRHDVQYEFTLHAESFAIGSAKIPAPEEEDSRARLEARVQQLRDLIESLDLLFDVFLGVRLSERWAKELGRMQVWLGRANKAAA